MSKKRFRRHHDARYRASGRHALGKPLLPFPQQAGAAQGGIADGLETGYRRLQAAVEGIDDAEQRLRIMIRTHLGNLHEDECQAPMLLYETRSLAAAARAEIAAIADRYQKPWQSTLDDLFAEDGQ